MKAFFKSIAVFSLVHFLIIQPPALAGGEREKPADTKKEFYSPNAEGLIGFTAEVPLDNPADNIFHVTVGTQLCGDEKVWLVYDLDGVEDHTAVSRSINDQLAVGGYLVKRRKGWATQRERINAAWLREGDNVIRFSMPADAQYSYRIKNLRIEVGAEQSSRSIGQVIVNQPSLHYFYDKAYIKGYVSGAGNENVRIRIEGHEARVFNGEFESIVDFASAENSCSLEIEAVYPDGSTTCHKVSFSQPETADYEYSLDGFTSRSERYFAKSTAETLSLDGAFLHAAADALRAGATLSITSLRAVDIPALDGGMVNVTKNHAGFRFLPHGMLFSKAADVRIPFDAEKIPDGYTQQDIRTYYFDEQSHHWIALALDTVLLEKGEVISKTLHFTDMINAIIKVPESPEVEAYNSTSMKGIKAANPTAAVNLINPPQADNTGNASLAYPLNLPAGRAGMQPQLAISYNSGGGNGWMGLGWNLSLPAISIDTRWGVPRYDPDSETETYTMNGEQLTPVAHRGTLRPRTSGGAEGVRFYPRVEGAFNKIVRHGDTPADYWWEVTDKSGTRYFYGAMYGGGLDKDAVLRDNEKGDGGNIAYWALREIRDLNGNGVQYHYAKPMDTGLASTSNPDEREEGYQLYIDRITYTDHNGADGKYQIVFTRDREMTAGTFERRQDVMISGNLGFKQVTADLLKKIEVQYEGKNIRHYELNYEKGGTPLNFFKTLLTGISEYDASGALFTTHTFDYYNDVAKGGTLKPLESEDATWNPQDDGIRGDFLNPFDLFNDDASALSGTKSSDSHVGDWR